MALMQDTLSSLAEKGTPISTNEYQAALIAALLHDIGHGPFSHTLEHELISQFRHEAMSRALLVRLNERFDGALNLALSIFDGTYERPFFHQLVSSQLDMDRLDYLRRDSFYTGVVEGRVGVDRLIKTMRVHPVAGGPTAEVVLEAKGIYAAENFLISRRLMYWQVYLHKTVLAGDQLLRSALHRARRLLASGDAVVLEGASPALLFFLRHQILGSEISDAEVLDHFCDLDDTDLLYSLKRWIDCSDSVLADLARRFIDRQFFRTAFLSSPPTADELASWKSDIADWLMRSGRSTPENALDDAAFYLTLDVSQHSAYQRQEDSICILERDGSVSELSQRADVASVQALTRFVEKPYVCFPKESGLSVEGTLQASVSDDDRP